MKWLLTLVTIFLFGSFIFFGCGSSGGGDGTSGTGGSDSTTTSDSGTADVSIKLSTSLSSGEELSPGGTAIVTVTLVDSSGDTYTEEPATVSFTSECANSGLAEIDESVTTVNGTGTVTYAAGGCVGDDTIVASATIGSAVTGNITITVAEASVGSVAFVSSEPETIALAGTGGTENSKVTFEVLDENGDPSSGKTVNFSLTTDIGGLSLTHDSAVSGQNGEVYVVVEAGTVATSVRVSATVNGTSITTVSDNLVVSTGLPDQNSFSISVDIQNPEAWDYDGVESIVTIRAADHFNNPVPDGTAVYFTTEGGSIEPSCTTVDGACEVTWTSQEPRPDASDAFVTILAIAIGEESFTDNNGNGVYDYTDTLDTDLPEAFRDDDNDDTYDFGEFFFDYDTDGVFDSADGKYNGVLCSDSGASAGLCTDDLVHVRADIQLTISTSFADVIFYDLDFNVLTEIDMRDDPDTCDDPDKVFFYVFVSDLNGNSMPTGTTITVSSSLGSFGGDTDVTITNEDEPKTLELYVEEVCGGVTSATVDVEVTTPLNNKTTGQIIVYDDG